eukprot:1079787_1
MATHLKRISSIVRKTFQQIRIYKSTHTGLSRFIPRTSDRPITVTSRTHILCKRVRSTTSQNNRNLCVLQRLYSNYPHNSFDKQQYVSSMLCATVLALTTIGGYTLSSNTVKAETKSRDPHPPWQAGDLIPSLPTFTRNTIKQHNTKQSLWLTYRHGVYDLTDFGDEHPGSLSRLLLACQGNHDISNWWHRLGYHNVHDVHQLLETFRIGNVSSNDMIKCAIRNSEIDPILKIDRNDLNDTSFSYEPFIAETPIDILHQYYYTPSNYHYVRNHYRVPMHLDLDSEFTISGIGIPNNPNDSDDDDDDEIDEGYTLKYKDILSLPLVTRDVYLQCGGHRRIEFKPYGKTKGSKWNIGAIGNGKYKGVLLRHVLEHIGVNVSELYANGNNDLYVWFLGADCAPDGEPYGISIPLYKALDPRGDVMFAFEYNDEPLTRDRGYPVRMIVPGWVGARSVKWIEEIIISDKECDLGSYTKSYRMTKDMTREIRGLPVNSAIHSPQCGEHIEVDGENKMLYIAGEAHSGDGNAIVRVDVSVDGGDTWHEATLLTVQELHKNNWGWTKWECEVDVAGYVSQGNTELELVCRAVDLNYNRQPESSKADLTFNPKGYGANPYHRIKINISSIES